MTEISKSNIESITLDLPTNSQHHEVYSFALDPSSNRPSGTYGGWSRIDVSQIQNR